MVSKLDKQTITSGFKSRWVFKSYGLVVYISKKLRKLQQSYHSVGDIILYHYRRYSLNSLHRIYSYLPAGDTVLPHDRRYSPTLRWGYILTSLQGIKSYLTSDYTPLSPCRIYILNALQEIQAYLTTRDILLQHGKGYIFHFSTEDIVLP